MMKLGLGILLLLCAALFLFALVLPQRDPSEAGSSGKQAIALQPDGSLPAAYEQSCTDRLPDSSVPGEDSNLPGSGWKIVWSDEFSGDCLDPSKWSAEDWPAEKNNELQYYTPSNVEVRDGQLILTSKQESYRGRAYTSGAVHTRGNFSFLYGKAEMRAKLPGGQGIFPAFWMMTDRKDTWLPEIDIMEMLGHQPDEVWMVSHWLDAAGSLSSASHSYRGPDFSKDFHLFSLEWTPDSLIWRIDGEEQFRVTEPIPKEPMYLYLNTAIGGNWPGPPDASTRFPATFEVDYVRVFQKTE